MELCRISINTKGIPPIFVDADPCPVKVEIVEIAMKYKQKKGKGGYTVKDRNLFILMIGQDLRRN